MRKLLPLALCLVMLLTACASAESLTGRANGYGGELTVSVRKNGDDFVSIEIVSHNETESVAGPALEQIPQEILAKNSTDVDVVAGATITSRAIIDAVNNAVGGGGAAAPEATAQAAMGDMSLGFGLSSLGRVGPGTDNEEVPVYSFNEVYASVLFDADGRVLDLYIDQLEVATPNYDGESMPQFSGFPGQGGYNYDENHDGTVDGKTEDTEDNFLAEIAGWKTKRQRGESYQMGTGTWAQQMDAFQNVFRGKTIEEIEAWFNSYCSNVNGRPLKADSSNAEDAAKYDALSDADKSMLADVTSSATMSLNDSHGNIIQAIRNAYDNRVPVTVGNAEAAAPNDAMPDVTVPDITVPDDIVPEATVVPEAEASPETLGNG